MSRLYGAASAALPTSTTVTRTWDWKGHYAHVVLVHRRVRLGHE